MHANCRKPCAGVLYNFFALTRNISESVNSEVAFCNIMIHVDDIHGQEIMYEL